MLLTPSPPLMSVGSPTEHDRQADYAEGGGGKGGNNSKSRVFRPSACDRAARTLYISK